MSAWRNPGLKALMEVAKERGPGRPSSMWSSILGPRINAGGRIGQRRPGRAAALYG